MIDGDDIFTITVSLIAASACLVACYVCYRFKMTDQRSQRRESEIVESMYDGLID